MWTKGLSTTRKDSANNKSNYSEKGLPNLDSRSRRFRLEKSFWREQLTAPGAESLVPKTCLELPLFAILIWDQIRQAKADFQLVLLVPGLRAWLRYWRSLAWWQGGSLRPPFDPVGEITQPIVTGPNRILIFH